MKTKVVVLVLALLTLGGCTRALVASYEPGMELENNRLSGQQIAVYQFEDKRAWINAQDEKSLSFIGQQGTWRFGMKYEDVDYQPVSAILQDVFIKEFRALGVDAFKGEDAATPAYSLRGEILNFEFENEVGVWTVTSRQHVSLALTLTDKNGKPMFANEMFNELNRENEGMAVAHSTNVEKLMKQVLKKVVSAVVLRTNDRMDLAAVTLNGIDITDQFPTLASLTEQ